MNTKIKILILSALVVLAGCRDVAYKTQSAGGQAVINNNDQDGSIIATISDEGCLNGSVGAGASGAQSCEKLNDPSIPVSAITEGDLIINPTEQCLNQTAVSFQTCIDGLTGGKGKSEK